MNDYTFAVTVSADGPEVAEAILAERLTHEEEYPGLGSPEYTIGWHAENMRNDLIRAAISEDGDEDGLGESADHRKGFLIGVSALIAQATITYEEDFGEVQSAVWQKIKDARQARERNYQEREAQVLIQGWKSSGSNESFPAWLIQQQIGK